MKVYFCTCCDAGLVFGRRRCRHCGERVGVSQHLPAGLPGWRSRFTRLGEFFASQASLSLATLLVFLGLGIALVPAGWSYALMQLHSASATVTQAPKNCQGLLVFFSEMATVGEVSALIGQVNAIVVAGPNRAGAFELDLPANDLDAAVNSLGNAEDTVSGVFLKSRCSRP